MTWMIYGANGYSGALIAKEAKLRGLSPILAGRNKEAITTLASSLDLPYKLFDLHDQDEVCKHISGLQLVLNCAGPFSKTCQSILSACLTEKVHYLDITGEISVFEYAQSLDKKAKEQGVLICPGVGFDVIPTDCIANKLKKAMPDATQLTLGFDSRSALSPGTTKTAIEGLAERGKVRKDKVLTDVPLAYKSRHIDFGNGEKLAMTIPWGDISTAYFSTHIPNIEVYIPTSKKQLSMLKYINFFRWLLRRPLIQSWLQKKASRLKGPNEKQRKNQKTWVWGEVQNNKGAVKIARVQTANGYELTVTGSLMVVDYIINNKVAGGYTTPALLLGVDAISSLPGCSEIEMA